MRNASSLRDGMRLLALVALVSAGGHALATPDPSDPIDKLSELPRISLEEIVVTGSRLKVKEAESAAPVTVIDRARIEELGVSTIPDLLKYLPQQAYTRGESFRFGAAQFVELRGLGVDTTLVLINGRRALPSATQVASNAFDLNTIPLSAVDRIEVLSDAASAVYGADAVGGVVNIILKRDAPTAQADIHYGAARGGAGERRVSLSFGASKERFRGSLALDHFERDFLLGSERNRSNDQDYRRFGSLDQRSGNANPGNITSRTAANLPGLPSRFAAVPMGSTGLNLLPADFLSTAGQRNLDSLSRYQSIVPESERRGAVLTAEYDWSSALTFFAEGLYSDRSTRSQIPPAALSGVAVPATNPFNPFGAPVSTNFLLGDLGPRQTVVETDAIRGVAGLRGLLKSWDWEVSFVTSTEDGEAWTLNDINAALAAAALAQTDPAHALNPFQDGPGGSPALLASLLLDPVVRKYTSEGRQWSGFVRGAPFTTYAGDVQFVIGGEHREEDILLDDIVYVAHGRRMSAAFAELQVPLVTSEMSIPGVDALSATVAARHDHYSDFGSAFNPQYGISWTPHPGLMLRASYGTSFRPPSLFELFSPRRTIPGMLVTDPRRNNEVAIVTLISGGNPALDPVEANSFTVGATLTPASIEGLRLSANYWRIELEDRVRIFPQQLVVSYEDLFPGRVVRADPTGADLATGIPGALISVDSSRVNFGLLRTSGIDLDLSWSISTALGDIKPSVSTTWVDTYNAVQAPETPVVDRVDQASFEGTIPSWRAVASLGWSRAGWSLSTTVRYIPSYHDAGSTGARNGRRVAAQRLLDIQATFNVGAVLDDISWLRGLKLSTGVSNLLDEEPSFSEIGSPYGYDLSQGDLRQRFGYVNLSATF